MRNDGWLFVLLPFLAGAVVTIISFYVGMYFLGPLISSRPRPSPPAAPLIPPTPPTLSPPSVPKTVARLDLDRVPERTMVIVEPLPRPPETWSPEGWEEQPPAFLAPMPPSEESSPGRERVTPEAPPLPPHLFPSPTPPRAPLPLPPAASQRPYRVRVGVFIERQNAERLMAKLAKQGYHPFLEEKRQRYYVYVGAFKDPESARRLKEELNKKGISAFVEEKEGEEQRQE